MNDPFTPQETISDKDPLHILTATIASLKKQEVKIQVLTPAKINATKEARITPNNCPRQLPVFRCLLIRLLP
ncbi:MAG: hypothetical protein WCI46_12910 [Verrucomicrobiota bacterium]